METMETIDEILGSMFITYMHAYCQAFKLKSLFLSYIYIYIKVFIFG